MTPATLFWFIRNVIRIDIKIKMKHKAYILNVNPSLSAEKPTIAGPKTKPEKPILDI